MPAESPRRTIAWRAALLLTLALAPAPALAQSRRPQRPQPSPTAPVTPTPAPSAQPGAPAAQPPGVATPAAPTYKPSPYLKLEKPKRWTLTARINIAAAEWTESVQGKPVPRHDSWSFDAGTVVFPLLGTTGSSILEVVGPADKPVPAVKGKVELNDEAVTEETVVIRQGVGGAVMHSGTWRAQWVMPPRNSGEYTAREMELEVTTSQSCYEVVFDEPGASKLDWPTGAWPDEAASTFAPQMFVDIGPDGGGYDMKPVKDLVSSWLEGNDPRKAKPVVLAKFLTGKVVEHVQISGEGLAYDKTGLWEGFDLAGAAETAITGRGSAFDLTCLLAAVYREVGLPARVVIGYDREGEGGKQVYLKQKGDAPELRSWVEFCLYDEKGQTLGWVPVDAATLRAKSSKLPPKWLERPAKFFGTHDELDTVAPIAFHFHPPTSVRAHGSAGFWGWFVTPTPPERAYQRVQFTIITTSRGGDSEPRVPESWPW